MAGVMIKRIQQVRERKRSWQRRFAACCYVVGACLFASFACASGELRDPTRPPTDLSSGNAGSLVTSGPQLQSVFISAHQRSAIISGQRFTIGEKLGDARVVGITESEVILKNGSGLQTLKLFPDVGKRILMRSPHHQH